MLSAPPYALHVAASIGHSMGGNVVLLHAARFDSVPLVVNLSGRFHLQHGIVKPPLGGAPSLISPTKKSNSDLWISLCLFASKPTSLDLVGS